MPETLPYRIYLRGELGKLRHTGDATDFLAAVDDGLLDRCELPKDVAGLTSRLSSPIIVAGIGGGTRWRTSLPASKHGGLSPCRSGKCSWCKQNEHTNGLFRDYFPKGTDLSIAGADDIARVRAELDDRPRPIPGWDTPAERPATLLETESVLRRCRKLRAGVHGHWPDVSW